ncbi:MAG: calcium-binding protein [Ilumatobacter sp.]|uniref:calcium-binding protein n=1 Tax=Ilumatobacter sp. TaxID=1967498 RepID=UPI002624E0F4|nr:calcium-binding protein [Ilumatobacter sp.]MDJ0771127.1 calcium-binding protein [Ilumatobacter sp.]
MKRTRLTLAATFVAAAALGTANTAHAVDPPPNDAFATATEVVLGPAPFEDSVDTTMATNDDPEDLEAKNACGSPPFFTPDPPDATVWYQLMVGETVRVQVSAVPPMFITPGFNVVADTPGGFDCVAGGPVEVFFIAEAGVQYYIQSIDDQIPPDWDGSPDTLDTEIGGELNVTVTSLGPPAPELCPGIAPDDPLIPPGLNLIVGTDGDDEIRGTNGPDLIFGLEGDDEIDGRGGDDIIFGCAGDDEIDAGKGNDFVIGDSADFFGNPEGTNGGDDEIDGGKGDDQIRGGPGNDEIDGGPGMDSIFGNQGDDEIDGGKHDDFVVGGFGDDEVNGGKGNDGVFGGFDSDELNGGPGDDFVNGDAPAEPPQGVDTSPHTDECDGGGGNDELVLCEVVDGDDDDDSDDDDSEDDDSGGDDDDSDD